MQAKFVNDVIHQTVKEIDPASDGQLNADDFMRVLQHLGVSDEELHAVFNSTPGHGAMKHSDGLVEWLFSRASSRKGTEAPKLGVIRLDYDYPPAPGDIDHSGSFQYDVFYRVVPGLTFAMCQAGKMTPMVEQNFVDAIKYLDSLGVSGITGDCGFMMWFQWLARKHTTKPVFMSALAHLPAVTCATSSEELIAVFTANGNSLEPMRELLKDECNIDADDKRLVIRGFQDVPGFEAVAIGGKVDVVKVLPGIVEAAMKTIKEHPGIRAICLECTELPPYADALRAATHMPVYDAITCADYFIRSRMDNPRVGLNEWQEKWDGVQEVQSFACHLSAREKAMVVNKAALQAAATTKVSCKEGNTGALLIRTPEYLKAQVPTLGVLRLDCEHDPVVGDVAHPETFPYPVYYRVVPGMTYKMCQSGKLSAAVEQEFIDAVKYFDDRNVSGITHDCGLAMHFQILTRRYTKRPVFLSPLAQLPAVVCAFAKHELILILTGIRSHFLPLIPLLRDECSIDATEKRFIIAPCAEVLGFGEHGRIPKTDADEKDGLLALVQRHLREYPRIRAIVSETTGLARFSDMLRAKTHLPVFDALTSCDLFINGAMDNPLFGLNGWQKKWDGKQETYEFGQNI